MVCKVYFRRFVALLLCCVLVCSSFIESAYATDPVTAASLAITGGQLAGAGLSGEAALSLAGPVGAVVGVTLGALGINAYVSKAAQEAGKTRTRFVLDKLVIWGAQAGYTTEQLYSKIAEGISVAADGTIQLANDAAGMIQQFGNWLFTQNDSVVENPVISESASIGSLTNLQFLSANTRFNYGAGHYIIAPFDCYVFVINPGTSARNNYIVSALPSSGAFEFANHRAIFSTYLHSSSGVPYVNFTGGWDSSLSDFPCYFNNISSSQVDAILNNNRLEITGQTYDEVFTGTPESWAENKDVLNPSADDTSITLNPDLLNPIIDSLADGQQATMSIIDYLQALQDAWDHALDDVQTAIGTITDSLTGIQEQIAVPQEAVKNPTVTNPSITPDTTPILDPSTVDPGTAVTGLSFDLTQIFPFCIPFDIYDMLATLSATPEAPVYHVHYEGPYNILIDFTVDLSPWDSVAAVLRTVELLAFCIGLAYVTRSMFIRS